MSKSICQRVTLNDIRNLPSEPVYHCQLQAQAPYACDQCPFAAKDTLQELLSHRLTHSKLLKLKITCRKTSSIRICKVMLLQLLSASSNALSAASERARELSFGPMNECTAAWTRDPFTVRNVAGGSTLTQLWRCTSRPMMSRGQYSSIILWLVLLAAVKSPCFMSLVCDDCGFATSNADHMTSHRRQHTGDMFYCHIGKICGRSRLVVNKKPF